MWEIGLNDTHREKVPSNKNSSAYEKYEYEHMGSWHIRSTLVRGSCTETKFSEK